MADLRKTEQELCKSLRQLHVTESLLFLNKVLAVTRKELRDPETEFYFQKAGRDTPSFVIHLITKYLMRMGRANTTSVLNWSIFPKIIKLAFTLAINDPISDSSDAEVLGSLVRMMSQQMRRQIVAQSYGLAIGIFQDLDAVQGPKPIDLRQEVEAAIKMPIELFMRIGQAAHGATYTAPNGVPLSGTLNLGWLTKAAIDVPSVPWVERWSDFAAITSLVQITFNSKVGPADKGDPYSQYRFNPLRRYPLIQVAADRYIAVDPWLVVERTSWGVFYDIFEKYQASRTLSKFTDPFGYAFERFVDNLIASVIPSQFIWREFGSALVAKMNSGSGKNSHKVGDLAVSSSSSLSVLIECTAQRPTKNLSEMAREEDLERSAERLAEEVIQTFEHIRAVQNSAWTEEGLLPGKWVGLVVTFGRFEMINSIWYRKLIDKHLGTEERFPYLILSLIELDCVIRLVENGHDFGEVILKCSGLPSYDPVGESYTTELTKDAVSTFAKKRCERMYDFLPPTSDELSELQSSP